MLFNPDWEKTFTLESFSAWLDQQPKGKRYRFVDADQCAIAQYLESRGIDVRMSIDRMKELGWVDIVCTGGTKDTFGAAALRARLILCGGWRLKLARFFGVGGLL